MQIAAMIIRVNRERNRTVISESVDNAPDRTRASSVSPLPPTNSPSKNQNKVWFGGYRSPTSSIPCNNSTVAAPRIPKPNRRRSLQAGSERIPP